MASDSTPSANEPANDLILVHTLQLKPMIKAEISRRMVISDVMTASVYSEKTRQKKLMMIMIMNKSQEKMVFGGRLKLTSTMKLWHTF